ncbi:MAG: stage II sporulation protein R [Oscillospiraceae bacterium]|nr:stage II sporulation protein R [Oscillospiraceae bacterium]
MQNKKAKYKFATVEVAVLLALAAAMLWGAWSLQRQDTLERKLIRLHVIANSDSQEDQELKLQVRDRVLVSAESILRSCEGMEQARLRLQHALPRLQAEAEAAVSEAGYSYPVTAHLERTEFPYKAYEGFALPSGEYLALRITLGEGQGKNWWCVVFPPLCTAAATDWSDEAVSAGLAEDDVSLITCENTRYVLKFRSLELWETIRRLLGK